MWLAQALPVAVTMLTDATKPATVPPSCKLVLRTVSRTDGIAMIKQDSKAYGTTATFAILVTPLPKAVQQLWLRLLHYHFDTICPHSVKSFPTQHSNCSWPDPSKHLTHLTAG